MKRIVGIILALVLVGLCAAALATGTYAVGTDSEPFSGDHTRQIVESLKKNGELDKITEQKGGSADRSDTTYLVDEDEVKSPDVVYGTSINNRVSLTWKGKKYSFWSVYEKINDDWKFLGTAMNKTYSISNVADGKHKYGVAAVRYDASTGDYYESARIRYVELKVLDGEDNPGAGADVREISFSGTKDQKIQIKVYDNTYLHIKTDSLTWFTSADSAVVMPDANKENKYTELGNNLCVKAAKHEPVLVVATLNYTKSTVDGKTLYTSTGIRAHLTIEMTYVKGKAPLKNVENEGLVYTLDPNKKTASVTGLKNKKGTKVTIPDKVKVEGTTYKVTKIAANAFKGLTKLKTVTIGKNVKDIGKNAFSGCKNLKNITIKTTKLTDDTVKAGAFANCHKKAVVKCPESKLAAYKKFLAKKGFAKTVKYKK